MNHSNEKNILAKWIPNENYNLLTNNCTQKTMEVFFLGSLLDGTSVKQYVMSNGYGISVVPNLNILNMQRVFYNQATNRAGFDAAMQQQRNKYQGKSPVVQWWYRMLQRNISIIDG